jgi:glycosyltransferase involved in cell wall biosynthesis
MTAALRSVDSLAPAVSVIVPAFEASATIAAAIDSILRQAWSDFEVIVVNDGSLDTPELVKALRPFSDRIRYLEQAHMGPGAARNEGIHASKGRWIAFLDSDDLWTEDFLDRQMAYLSAHPACDLVYCDANLSGESPLAGRRFMEAAPSEGAVTLEALLAGRCTIPLSTVIVRRKALFSAGLFDEDLEQGEDLELMLRLALRGVRMAYQNDVLADRRTSAGGLFGSRIEEFERVLNVLECFGRAHVLPVAARTALRVRAMAFVDRLEIERAKLRLVEGKFGAAQYHLSASRRRGVGVRAARVALRLAPRLARRIYIACASPVWTPYAAALRVD